MKLKGVIHKIKYFTIALTLIAIISTPAISDLSQDDLNKIRLLIADELKPIQTEIQTVKTEIQTVKTELKDAIASVKEDVASLSGRVDGVEKLITWLMVIIVAIVGIPQVVVLWRSKKDRILEKQVETLTQKIEALEKQRIQSP